MTADDLFLGAQAAIDRLVRRLRLGAAPASDRRRLLIVQIDGLSRAVLDQAMVRGYMPVLRRLLNGGGSRLTAMTVGIPTSTPAFHMATMYGVQPDIPGFHYHDKRRRTDIHFPRAGHAAFVEASQAANRAGILRGGSVYGCAFTGGAENDFFSFARLTRPRAPGLLRVLTAFVLVGWVAAKCAVAHGRRARADARPHRAASEPARPYLAMVQEASGRVGVDPPVVHVRGGPRRVRRRAGDLRQLPRLRRSGPRVRPPERGNAFAGLRAVDRSLRQIRRALRRVPGYRYDLYVLSDHGQAASTPYSTLAGGRRFERVFLDEILPSAGDLGSEETAAEPEIGGGASAVMPPTDPPASAPGRPPAGQEGLELGFEPYLDVREACERGGVRVVSAGPNAFVYFLDTPGTGPPRGDRGPLAGTPGAPLEERGRRVRPGARDGRPGLLLARSSPVVSRIPSADRSRSGRIARWSCGT